MQEIKKRQIKMRPRIYFVMGSMLLGIGLAGAVLAATFFTNFFFFKLRAHSPFGYLRMGRSGLRFFLLFFPWWPLLVAAAGILGGLALLRRYEISYKKSFFLLVIVFLTFILASGFLLHSFGFNERAARMKHLRPLYRQQMPPGRFPRRF